MSPERVKLWSYGDLMALRTIYWLRQTKQDPSGREVPRTAMKAVRRALSEIAALELDLWSEDGAPLVAVDRSGGIVIEHGGRAQRPEGQSILDADMLDLLAPFASREGLRGPDLNVPRPRLRIVPGKLGGSPTSPIPAWSHRRSARWPRVGSGSEDLPAVPDIEPAAIEDALDLERQLAQNLQPAIAA